MRKIKIALLLAFYAGLVIVVTGLVIRHYHYSKPIVQPKKCTSVYAPCFEITMPNNPTYNINGWQHYGDWNCVIFNSLPDNGIHGYCGRYSIQRIHRAIIN